MLATLKMSYFQVITTCKLAVLMAQHFDYHPITSEGDNQNEGSSVPVISSGYDLEIGYF